MQKLARLSIPFAAGIVCTAAQVWSAPSAERAIPNFASTEYGWIAVDNEFIKPASGPGPVTFDPAYPYIGNNKGGQPTYRVADLTNPILKPFAIERLRRANEVVLAGKSPFIPRERCWPGGVPGFLLYPIQPVYFIQTPKEVWLILQYDHQVRRVYLDRPHSANPKPSWFGESIGHYDGDSLVVDTIGISTKTTIDNYQTPHTTALHVVERFHIIGGGKQLEVNLTVEDAGAFTRPWSAKQLYDRADQEMLESVCAENNGGYFSYDVAPIPEADRPDF
jgi:hypothetical protein